MGVGVCSDTAVRAIMEYLGVGGGREVVLVETCCISGTHRNVAAAEIMAGKLGRRGVGRVVVRHLHRVRGWGIRGEVWLYLKVKNLPLY